MLAETVNRLFDSPHHQRNLKVSGNDDRAAISRHANTPTYVQDERHIAKEHKDVRRDCVNIANRQEEESRPRLRINGPS